MQFNCLKGYIKHINKIIYYVEKVKIFSNKANKVELVMAQAECGTL